MSCFTVYYDDVQFVAFICILHSIVWVLQDTHFLDLLWYFTYLTLKHVVVGHSKKDSALNPQVEFACSLSIVLPSSDACTSADDKFIRRWWLAAPTAAALPLTCYGSRKGVLSYAHVCSFCLIFQKKVLLSPSAEVLFAMITWFLWCFIFTQKHRMNAAAGDTVKSWILLQPEILESWLNSIRSIKGEFVSWCRTKKLNFNILLISIL